MRTGKLAKNIIEQDLIEHVRSEISGDFEHAITSLMQTPAEFDTSELYWAMQGAGRDEATLIEIMCTRSNVEIAAIKNAYKTRIVIPSC